MSPPPAQDVAEAVEEESQEPETNTEEVEADMSEVPDEAQPEQHEKHEKRQKHKPVENQQQSRNNNQHNDHQQFSRQSGGIQKFRNNNKNKTTFKRIDVDPSRKYHTPEARESWGPNVKGKKFRKEKGKKKRSTGTGARIDGSVRSVRLDA